MGMGPCAGAAVESVDFLSKAAHTPLSSPATAKGGAPGTSPKPKSAESSPPVAKKPSPGSPPKVAKKPTGSPKVAKKPMAPPKTGASAMPAKKPSIMELVSGCGQLVWSLGVVVPIGQWACAVGVAEWSHYDCVSMLAEMAGF